MKKEEERKRGETRANNFQKAMLFLEQGDVSNANHYFQMAVKVTRKMVRNLARRLQKEGIEFVVAPYEADAQLAYLFRQGEIDFVISEDSDMVLFGIKKLF
eukprot:UN22204